MTDNRERKTKNGKRKRDLLLSKPEIVFSPYKRSLIELGRRNKKVLVIGADLANSCEIDGFKEHFPDRFFNLGSAEQNAVDTAVGLAFEGEIPLVHSFGVFMTRRPYEQVAVQMAMHNANVKLIGVIPGLTSRLGPTHQAIDDLALMRLLPGMTVIDPSDATEIEQALSAIVEYNGPVYMRMMRREVPRFLDPKNYKFRIGKATFLASGDDLTLISCGMMLEEVLKAYDILNKKGLKASVLNISTIKPLDKKAVLKAVDKTGILITVENHLLNGGLSSAIAELLVEERKTKVILKRIGLNDIWAIPGSKEFLFKKYGFDGKSIAKMAVNTLRYHCKL